MVARKLAILATAFCVLGCGEDPVVPPPDGTDPDPWVNEPPILDIYSPGEMAVGDTLTILGQKFVDPAHGSIYLIFKGTYFDSQGGASPVDLQVNPKVNLTTDGRRLVKSLSWDMWPNIVFHKTGDQLGRFRGHLIAINQGKDGTEEVSDPLPVSIEVKPSILPRLSQPVNAGCAPVVRDTLEGQPMAFMAEVVGLRPGTKDSPLTFRWTFRAEEWKLGFANDPTANPSLNPFFTLDPAGVIRPKSGPIMLEHKVTDGKIAKVGAAWDVTYLVKATGAASESPLGVTRVKEVVTGQIGSPAGDATITVNVEASEPSGKSVRLAIKLNIHHVAELLYDGNSRIVEYFEPKPLSGCVPGGDIGSDLSYSESESERRDRSLSYNWNTQYGSSISVGAGGGQWLAVANWNVSVNLTASLNYGFGVNVAESVSSDKSASRSLSKHILPGYFGMVYRQTVKVHRVGQVVGNTACGQTVPLGDAILTDWIWSPDVATGRTCPPRTGLPPAQKLE